MLTTTHALLIIQRKGSFLKPFLDNYLTSIVCENKNGCKKCINCLEILNNKYNSLYWFDQINPFKRENALQLARIFNRERTSVNNKNIYLIEEIEKLSSNSINSLLRLVEDSPINSYGIFTTKNESLILSTFLSRVQKVVLKKASKIPFKVSKNDQEIITSFFTVDEQIEAIENGSFNRFKIILDACLNKKTGTEQIYHAWQIFRDFSNSEIAQLITLIINKTENIDKKSILFNCLKVLPYNPPKSTLFANLVSW